MRKCEEADFGFANVGADEKAALVGGVFSKVAPYYASMNDVMSAGLHRRWKSAAVLLSGARAGMRVLDLACGGGDLAKKFLRRVTPGGGVVLADINAEMLDSARSHIAHPDAQFIRCDGESLPFENGEFDIVSCGFGLRNMTRRDRALEEMRRVLRPGGLCMILEFSPPTGPLAGLQKRYLSSALPAMGKMLFNDAESYRYLGESIMRFPARDQLEEMMRNAGFARADSLNLFGGVVLLHRGRKLD